MKKFNTILIVTIALLMVPGFLWSAAQAETAKKAEVVELTVWFGRQNFIPDDGFDAFHAKYPNIKVKADVIPLEQALTEGAKAISAGVGPDIVQTDSRRLPPFVEAGLVQPMDKYIEMWKSEDPANYNALSSSAWEHASHNGKLYGVSIFAGPFNNAYRIDWLDKLGLSVPQTWEEVLAVARATRDAGLGYGFVVRGPNSTPWFFAHYMAMGGKFVDNIIQLDSPAGIYALTFYQTLVKEKLVSEGVLSWGSDDMRAAFITGRAMMAPIGTNIFPNIQKEMAYGEKWGATPMLPREGYEKDYTYASLGWPMIVTSSCEHPYEASLVLRYLAENDNAKSVARRYQPTTVTSVWSDPEYLAEQPWASDFEDALNNMTRTPATVFITQVDNIVLDALGEVMENVYANPAEVAKRYQKQLDALGK
ncbi:MAG: sugar ABC transporter substrate-binding protein [Sphaerochaeta sp.]|nr:sugar ABC transporter substrate-binding protein [Sphaerochaeta sp.]